MEWTKANEQVKVRGIRTKRNFLAIYYMTSWLTKFEVRKYLLYSLTLFDIKHEEIKHDQTFLYC